MPIIDILIPAVLALTMFGVGTSLEIGDFREIAAKPRLVGLGLGLQMLFLPVTAIAIALLLPIAPAWKMGILILALCPGGATSNFISYLLELRTALSISLTAINSVLILATIPLGVNLGALLFLDREADLALPVMDTVSNVLLVVLLPVALGLLFHHQFKDLSERLKQPTKIITTTLLALVFGIKFFAGEEHGGSQITGSDMLVLGPIMLVFHGFTMMVSYWAAGRLRATAYDAITIGIEVGLQNTALALLVASVMLADAEMTKPTLVYAIFSFFTTLAFGYLAKRYSDRRVSKNGKVIQGKDKNGNS